MGTTQVRTGLLTLLLVATSHALPRGQRTGSNFVGEGTNELATAILQGYVDTETNMAFSPLGYSTLLAILAEGASGETRRQLESALRLPKDRQEIRSTYLAVLERLREKNQLNKPELRNWFYVYKNFTVEQSYRDILLDNYLTDVKSVERPGGDMGFQLSHDSMTEAMTNEQAMPVKQEESTSGTPMKETMEGDSNTKPMQDVDKTEDAIKNLNEGSILEEAMSLGGMKEEVLIEMAIQEDSTRTESIMEVENEEIPMKEVQGDAPMVEEMPLKDEKPMDETNRKEEKQPMIDEKPIKNDAPKEEEKQMDEETNENPTKEDKPIENEKPLIENQPMEDTSTQKADEKPEEEEEEHEPMKEEAPMKLDKPMDEEAESMMTSETKHTEERALLDAQDITSSLSGNNLVSKAANGTTSQMIIFNGMYFKGSWAIPFEKKSTTETFYQSESKKKAVSMMRAQGKFSTGSIPELDCTAVELPYEGERYSLLVLVPNSRGGLSDLIASLTGYSLRDLHAHMVQREVEILLPCFNVETITKPIKALGKFGVSDVFSAQDAELPGISQDSGLYVQELVQLVTLRVDDSSSKANQLTSSSLESRSGDDKKFIADHPFLYFVRDTVDNLIVVAGKIMDPNQLPTPHLE